MLEENDVYRVNPSKMFIFHNHGLVSAFSGKLMAKDYGLDRNDQIFDYIIDQIRSEKAP